MVIEENIKLSDYTTYRIGGEAKYFASCKSEQDIKEAIAWANKNKVEYFVLGGGSNVLASDKGYSGLVVSIQNNKYEFKGTKLTADAGVMMHVLVENAADKGLEGLEWAGGLPGQLGGAIRGNAGAFGGEIKDVITSVTAVDAEGNTKEFNNEECEFAYRDSFFKKNPGWTIVSASMSLKEGSRGKLLGRVTELVEWRRTKHPMEYGNSGSIFKRKSLEEVPGDLLKKYPDAERAIREGQIASAFFIDQAGLKLRKVGGAEVSDKHPNFIVNKSGNATAEDVIMLSGIVKSQVLHQFGVLLEEEIHYLH